MEGRRAQRSLKTDGQLRNVSSSILQSFEIKSIRIYPIKSCQAFEVPSAQVTKWGLKNDRRWAIVGKEKLAGDEVKWHVENIFEMMPQMAKIKPEIAEAATGPVLRLSAHGMPPIQFPIRTVSGQKPNIFLAPINNANPSIQYAEDEGTEVADWVTKVLNQGGEKPNHTFHLVWMPPEVSAKCSAHPTYGHLFSPDVEMSFAAKAQILVANEASVDALNVSIKKMGDHPVDIRRFRPNFIIRGEAFEEETWRCVRIGDAFILRCAMSAIRCVETTVNMADHEGGWAGTRDKSGQPFKAMKKYHAGPAGKPRFGTLMNRCFVDSKADVAEVKVGDHLTVVEHLDASTLLDNDMSKMDGSTTQVRHTKEEVNRLADDFESAASAAKSGDGTVANVGIKLDGQIQCPNCSQKFTSDVALQCHFRFIHDPNRHQED